MRKQTRTENKAMIIDHVGLRVSNFEKSKEFYIRSLEPLGISLLCEEDGNVGFGKHEADPFWIGPNTAPSQRTHIAFKAETRSQVDKFYEAAIAAGGIDNGPPGLRKNYHADYYAAFIIDPDGNNIEAVCRKPA